ncbi:TIM21 protein [Ostertagia ostertagi]
MYIDYTAMQPYFVRCWLVSDAPNMSSALFLRLGNTTVTHRLKFPWVAYSPRVLLRQPLDHRWLCGTRNFAEKRGTIAPQNKEQTGLQRSVLEEVLIKEKQKPTTFTGKACFEKTAGVHDLFGPTIAGFGEETSRGRRRHVAHHKYEKDGRQRIRVLFHVKGERDEGIAQAEMEQRDGEWQWRFLYVETKRRPKTTHVLIDNR